MDADQENNCMDFTPNHWDSMKQFSVMLSATRLLHHMSQIFREALLPRDATTMRPRIDKKRMQALREGHKADAHEEQQQNGCNMTMQ